MFDMWFVYLIGAVLIGILFHLAYKKAPKPSRPVTGKSTMHDHHTDEAAGHYNDERYRDGGTVGFSSKSGVRVRDDLDEPWKRATENLRKYPPREAPHPRPISKSPALSAPYGQQKPATPRTITLTPRELERVNTQRRLAGRPPLNKAGFKNAIAHAWDQPRRQPDTTNGWLTYFILYQVFLADHQQLRLGVDGYITIKPDEPYNGQGGEFAGAGASGSWEAPAATAAALAVGYGAVEPATAGDGYHFAPDAPAQPSSAPDPTPSYSAPDPTPSYSPPADSGGGYSGGGDTGGGSSGGGGGD